MKLRSRIFLFALFWVFSITPLLFGSVEGDTVREFLSRIITAGTETPPVERELAIKKALAEFPQLYQWIADGKTRQMLADSQIPIPAGLIDNVETLAGNFFQNYVMPYYKKTATPAQTALVNEAAQTATREAARKFAAMTNEQRMDVLNRIPKIAYSTFGNEMDIQIDRMDPGNIPAVKELTHPSTPVEIPGLSKEHNEMIVNLISGYFVSLELNHKKRIIGSLIGLPADATPAKQLSTALQNSGPVLQKVLQLAGKRSDSEIVRQAAKELLSSIKPIPPDAAKKILEKELGRPYEEVFEEFDFKSLAAASVGQVHRARLKGSNDWIIVKLLRPGIREAAKAELRTLRKFATDDLAKDLLNKLESNLMAELDLRKEAQNLQDSEFYQLTNGGITLAKLVDEIKPTENLIATRFARGKPIDFKSNENLNELLKKGQAMSRLLRVWIQEAIFGDGRFHADLHEGNLFWWSDLNERAPDLWTDLKTRRIGWWFQNREMPYQMTLIDFGSMGKISAEDRRSFVQLFISLGLRDPVQVNNAISNIFEIKYEKLAEMKPKVEEIVLNREYTLQNKVDSIIGQVVLAGGKVPESLMMFTRGLSFLENHMFELNKELDTWDPDHKYKRFHTEHAYIRAALMSMGVEGRRFIFEGRDYRPSVAAQAFWDFSVAYGKKLYHYVEGRVADGIDYTCDRLLEHLSRLGIRFKGKGPKP